MARRGARRFGAAAVMALLATLVAGVGPGASPAAATEFDVLTLAQTSRQNTWVATPNGRYLVANDGTELRSFDAVTGAPVALLTASLDPAAGVFATTDSRHIVFVRTDGSGTTEVVSVAPTGADMVVLASVPDTDFGYVTLDHVTGRVLLARFPTEGQVSFSSIPAGGGAEVALLGPVGGSDPVALHGGHLVVSPGTPGPVTAHPLGGGSAVELTASGVLRPTFDPDRLLHAVTDDLVVWERSGGGLSGASVHGGPVTDYALDVLAPGTDIDGRHATVPGIGQVSAVGLRGGGDITVDTSALEGVTVGTMLGPDGQSMVFQQFSFGNDAGIYWVSLAGTPGPRTAQLVPGTELVELDDVVLLEDQTVVFPGAVVGGQRPYHLWQPGELTVRTTDPAPWDGGFALGSWVVTPDGGGIWVTDGVVLTWIVLFDGSGRALEVEVTDHGVVDVFPVSGGYVYGLTPGDCFGPCPGPLRMVELPPFPTIVPARPDRLMDSRPGGTTVDGLHQAGGPVSTEYRLAVADRGDVSPFAAAVTLNVAAVAPTADGNLSVYPCGTPPQPSTATVNFRAGLNAIANNALVGLDGDGDVCIVASTPVHVVVDVTGWAPAGTGFRAHTPVRMVDTRAGASVAPGGISGVGDAAALDELVVPVAGLGPIGANAAAVAVNVVAVNPSASGFAVAYPCDSPRPLASSINFPGGVNAVANAGVVAVAATGEHAGAICVHTNVATDLVVDVTAWFAVGSEYVPMSPVRLMDTRPGGAPNVTIDGVAEGEGILGPPAQGAMASYDLVVAGRGGVPQGAAGAVVLNVVAARPTASGFLTVYSGPCTEAPPSTATLNFDGGAPATANGAVVGVFGDGHICILVNQPTHVVVDLVGFIPSSLV